MNDKQTISSKNLILIPKNGIILKKILVIDDDYASCLVLNEYLNEFGVDTITEKDGKKALPLLKAHPDIDLIFLDLFLHDSSGYEICKKIKILMPELPVIAYTACFTLDVEKKCYKTGFDDILYKPVRYEKIYKIIMKYNNLKLSMN